MTSSIQTRDRRTAGYVLLVLTAGAYLPTPLYPGYREQFDFGDLTMTLIYATFAVVALPVLLLTGRIVHVVGPRRLLWLGVVLAGLGTAGFALAQSQDWLFAARVAHGLALGVSTGPATVLLGTGTRGRPDSRSGRLPGPLIAGVTFVSGTAIGPLLSGPLAQYGPGAGAAYLVHLGLLAFGAYRLGALSSSRRSHRFGRSSRARSGGASRASGAVTGPTTDPRPVGSAAAGSAAAGSARVPPNPPASAGTGRAVGRSVLLASATGFLAWTVAGLFLALMPAVLGQTLGTSDTALTGGVVGLVLIWSVLAQPAVARLGATAAGAVATVMLLVSLVLLALGTSSLLLLATTTVLAGVGHGLGYGSAAVTVDTRTPEDRRAALTSVVYVACYVGAAVPAVAVGVLAHWHDLTGAVTLLALALVPVALLTVAGSARAMARERRSEAQDRAVATVRSSRLRVGTRPWTSKARPWIATDGAVDPAGAYLTRTVPEIRLPRSHGGRGAARSGRRDASGERRRPFRRRVRLPR